MFQLVYFTFFGIAPENGSTVRWLPLVFFSYICCYNCSCHCVVVAVIHSLLLFTGLVPKKLPHYITIYCFKKNLLIIYYYCHLRNKDNFSSLLLNLAPLSP